MNANQLARQECRWRICCVNLDNASGADDTSYHTSYYPSANLVWQL